MRALSGLLLCALVVAFAGCGDDDEAAAGGGAAGPGTGGGGTGLGGGGGTGVGGSGGVGGAAAVFAVPDVDDDDADGQIDWEGAPAPADNELAPLTLPADFLATVAAGDDVELSLVGAEGDVTVWLDGDPVLGQTGAATPVTSVVLSGDAAKGALSLEAGTFRRKSTLHARHLAGGEPVATLDVDLWAAPLVLNHHGQAAERVWVVESGSNDAMIQLLSDLLGPRLVIVQSSDVWIQDELEWATATAPGHRLDVAMDSIRDRDLDAYVKGLKAPDIQPITWGVDGTAKTEDKFGNLETTPPLTVGATSYPFGRIYYGDKGEAGPNAIIKAFLDDQRLQAPIQVDTSWLCVGHVDEFMAFVADSAAPKGFRLFYADVDAGYALLDGLPAGASIPRYSSAHGYAAVGDIVADDVLRALNTDIQADYLDPILADLEAKLGLDEGDVVRVPALFERIPNCAYSSAFMEVAALIPALVNFTVVNVDGQAPHLVVPDPFLRSNGAAQAVDPVIQAFTAQAPASYALDFVDDWYTYHVSMGEVHCGTNVQRTPTPDWWTQGLPLLAGGTP